MWIFVFFLTDVIIVDLPQSCIEEEVMDYSMISQFFAEDEEKEQMLEVKGEHADI